MMDNETIPRAGGEHPTIRFTGIHHVSVVVTDPDRAAQFYEHVLGMKRINKPRTFSFHVVWFELGDQQVHLIPRGEADTKSPRHMALHVGDAQEARVYFHQHDVEVHETTPIPGADRFFIDDPDGNRIECIQWHRPYDSAENAESDSP